MMKDYKPSERVEVTEYELLFYVDSSGGLGFPCDEVGNVDRSKLQGAAIRNLDYALSHPEHYPYCWNTVKKYRRSYREPASGICNCGERIELYNEYMGAYECPNCGQWWNLFGQELKNPETWKDGDDW